MPPVSSRTTSRSTPVSTSGLSVEANSKAGASLTGRRLANRPSALRMPSSPCSGRTFAVGLSHLGPPTAPSSTASLHWHKKTVSGGSGCPVASIAQPPRNSEPNTNSWPKRLPMASNTLTASAVTSGPMPSPGKSAIVAFIGRGSLHRRQWPAPAPADTRGRPDPAVNKPCDRGRW